MEISLCPVQEELSLSKLAYISHYRLYHYSYVPHLQNLGVSHILSYFTARRCAKCGMRYSNLNIVTTLSHSLNYF